MQRSSLTSEISAATTAIPGLTAPDEKRNHFQRRKEENWQIKMLIRTIFISQTCYCRDLASPLINEKCVGGSLITQAPQQVPARYQGYNLETEKYNLRHFSQSYA